MADLFFWCFYVYFLPALIARDRNYSRTIFALNFALGWTVIGWFIALTWAYAASERKN